MNGYVVVALALMAIANIADATFIWGTTAAASTVTLGAGSATALGLLGGVVLLKGLVLKLAYLSSRRGGSRRGRRSPEDEDDAAFVLQDGAPLS